MNTLHVATVLTVALLILPAYAQQGPAGVPGVVELLVESVTPVIASEPAQSPPAISPPVQPVSKTAPAAKTPGSLNTAGTRPRAAKKVRKPAQEDCSKAKEPARCQLFEKARKTCLPAIGETHRQCLRDVLTAHQ